MPLALAVMGVCTLVLLAAGWVLRWWSSGLRLQYAVLAASIAVVAQLAAWQLIGYGLR
jgi:hypothetical protein